MKIRYGPAGIHLFDRASGLNVLIDEIIPHQSKWTAAPRQVSIALTNACDLKCRYCFAPKNHSALAVADVTRWLSELDSNGTIGVGFGGGEPTLYPQLRDICAYAAQHTGLAVTFTTHGQHLTDRFLSDLQGNVHFVRVSMDGLGATYERLRGRSFGALRERLLALRTITKFGINYVVNADTLPDIRQAAAFAEEVGAAEFLLLPQQSANGVKGIDAPTAKALRLWVMQFTGMVRLAISQNGADGMPTSDPFPRERGLRAFAHIDARGVLKHTSYGANGEPIDSKGIMYALRQLRMRNER